MDSAKIREATARVVQFFRDNPDKGLVVDKAAVAKLDGGLLCRAEGPKRGGPRYRHAKKRWRKRECSHTWMVFASSPG